MDQKNQKTLSTFDKVLKIQRKLRSDFFFLFWFLATFAFFVFSLQTIFESADTGT